MHVHCKAWLAIKRHEEGNYMSILNEIEKPKDRPVLATILGDAGLGKTSLAASFPKPIVIRAEDGLQSIPLESRPDALPVLKSSEDLWTQLTALIQQDHDYQTLIIDSVTALDRLFTTTVMESDPKKPASIAQALGGYGAGFLAISAMHHRTRKFCGWLNENKNMHIVFIGHADTETIELPDQDAYTRYTLRLNKRSVAPYVDDCDLVGFMKLQTFTTGDGDRKKARSDGTRLLVTYATAANVSKNRYGITEDIEVTTGINPLKQYIPSLNINKKGTK